MGAAGISIRAALVREATVNSKVWPSAEVATVTQLLPFLQEDVDNEFTHQVSTDVDSRGQVKLPKIVQRLGAGPIASNIEFQGNEIVWAMVMGFQAPKIGGISQPEEVVAGEVYRHLFEVDDGLDARPWKFGDGFLFGSTGNGGDNLTFGQRKMRRASWVVDKVQTVWETRSVMLDTLTLSSNSESNSILVTTIGYDTNYGTVNNGNLSALSCATTPEAIFQNCVIRLAPVSDTVPLGPADVISPGIEALTVTINNNLQARTNRDTKTFIDEPRRQGSPQMGGTFNVGSYENTNVVLQQWFQDQTPLMMTVEYTGEEIPPSTGEFYQLTLYFPSVTLTGENLGVSGPGQIKPGFSWVATKPAVQPAGFPTNLRQGPMMVELVNKTSTHSLL